MTEQTSETPNRADQEEIRKRYREIGEALAARRQALGLELGDVAKKLRLPGMVITDIESGRVDRFSGLYRRGYIGNYARLLDLDPEPLLSRIGEDAPPELHEVLPVPRRPWRLDRYLKIATYALVTTVIVPPLAYFFIAGGSRLLERDPEATPAGASTSETVGQQQVARLGDSSPGGEAAGGADRPEASAGHVSASALPLSPMRLGRPQEDESADLLPQSVSLAESDSEDGVSELSGLRMTVQEDSWIEIHDADGERLEYDLLRAGQVKDYQGRAPFRVLLGRSNAVDLQVDGQSIAWEGEDRGDVTELEIDAQGRVLR